MPTKAIELTSFDLYKRLLGRRSRGADGKRAHPGGIATTVAGALAGEGLGAACSLLCAAQHPPRTCHMRGRPSSGSALGLRTLMRGCSRGPPRGWGAQTRLHCFMAWWKAACTRPLCGSPETGEPGACLLKREHARMRRHHVHGGHVPAGDGAHAAGGGPRQVPRRRDRLPHHCRRRGRPSPLQGARALPVLPARCPRCLRAARALPTLPAHPVLLGMQAAPGAATMAWHPAACRSCSSHPKAGQLCGAGVAHERAPAG